MDIKCLSGGCPKRYTEAEVKYFVDADVYYKFRKFYNKQIKENNPYNIYVNCPFVNCDELVDITYIASMINMVDCNANHHFCVKCKKSYEHGKEECKELDLEMINEHKKDDHYKQCPECNVILERDEKENRMICINCQYDFCWLCLKAYTSDHYASYNVAGCPGMEFSK